MGRGRRRRRRRRSLDVRRVLVLNDPPAWAAAEERGHRDVGFGEVLEVAGLDGQRADA